MVTGITENDIVVQSRATAIIILVSYGLYLMFQLKTHRVLFEEPSKKNQTRGGFKDKIVPTKYRTQDAVVLSSTLAIPEEDVDPDDSEEPQLAWTVALSVMVLFTVLLAFCAEFATNSIQQMVRDTDHLSQTFIGFVILPILSNDPNAINVAMMDKMDLSLGVTLEKCMQTSLLVVPLVVIIDWCMSDDQVTLEFDGFSVSALFVSVIVVTYMISDGKSNWLSGALLVKIYVIIALASYFIKTS